VGAPGGVPALTHCGQAVGKPCGRKKLRPYILGYQPFTLYFLLFTPYFLLFTFYSQASGLLEVGVVGAFGGDGGVWAVAGE
jgi:hypothetical protein